MRRRPGSHSPPAEASRHNGFQPLMRWSNCSGLRLFRLPSSPHPRQRRCQTPARQPPTKRHTHPHQPLAPQPPPHQFPPIGHPGHHGQHSRSSDHHSRSKCGRSTASSIPAAGVGFVLEPNVNTELHRRTPRPHLPRLYEVKLFLAYQNRRTASLRAGRRLASCRPASRSG